MTYFTEKEEELGSLFMQIGIKKNAAKVLVFLANSSEATSHAIERGTDLRQPEVSLAIRYLMDQGWIMSWESKAESKGRPVKIYALAKPIANIMDCIEKENNEKATNQLKLIKELRDYLH